MKLGDVVTRLYLSMSTKASDPEADNAYLCSRTGPIPFRYSPRIVAGCSSAKMAGKRLEGSSTAERTEIVSNL